MLNFCTLQTYFCFIFVSLRMMVFSNHSHATKGELLQNTSISPIKKSFVLRKLVQIFTTWIMQIITWTLYPPFKNNEPVPQVLKQVVNLSCYLWNTGLETGIWCGFELDYIKLCVQFFLTTSWLMTMAEWSLLMAFRPNSKLMNRS